MAVPITVPEEGKIFRTRNDVSAAGGLAVVRNGKVYTLGDDAFKELAPTQRGDTFGSQATRATESLASRWGTTIQELNALPVFNVGDVYSWLDQQARQQGLPIPPDNRGTSGWSGGAFGLDEADTMYKLGRPAVNEATLRGPGDPGVTVAGSSGAGSVFGSSPALAPARPPTDPNPPGTPAAGSAGSVFSPARPPVSTPQPGTPAPGSVGSVFSPPPSTPPPAQPAVPSTPSDGINWNHPQAPAGWGVGPDGKLHAPSEKPGNTPSPATPAQPERGPRVPSPADLIHYKEGDIIRDPSGAIYLRPGVPIRWTVQPGEQPPARPPSDTPPPGVPSGERGPRVPGPADLANYREDELIRDPNGNIYLKPGVDVRWEQGPARPPATTPTPATAPTPTTSEAPTGEFGTHIPDPAYLKFYTEEEIVRGPDGKIYLKPGVDVRWEGAPEADEAPARPPGTDTPPPTPETVPKISGETEDEWAARIKAAEDAYLAALGITPEMKSAAEAEAEAERQLQNLINSKELNLVETAEQPIATGFITGQQAAIERRASVKALPLQTQLAQAQAKRAQAQEQRQAAIDVAQAKLGFTTKAQERAEVKRKENLGKIMQIGSDLVRVKEDGTTTAVYTSPKDPSFSVSYQEDDNGNITQILVNTNTGETTTKMLGRFGENKSATEQKHSPSYYEWQDAVNSGYAGSFNDYQTMDANRRRSITNINTGASGDLKETSLETTALGYYIRAKDSLDTLETGFEAAIQGKGLSGQARLQFAPNFLQSQENQVYRQLQRQFTEARLRKESGAAIPPNEYENDARTYFAQPGDTVETLQRKKSARSQVLESLRVSAGNAYLNYYGIDARKVVAPSSATESSLGDPLGIR